MYAKTHGAYFLIRLPLARCLVSRCGRGTLGRIASPAQFAAAEAPPPLERSLGLGGAVAVNMLDMIGVGPFITLPLLIGAMGGPQAMLGWVLGALLAVADGLVWAELAAALPEAGGTYRFLRAMFPGTPGRFLAFLFCCQLLVSAPLSVASGCLGLAQYAAYVAPALGGHAARWGRLSVSPVTAVAIAAIALATLLLYRRLARLRVVSAVLWTTVMATLLWIFATGVALGQWSRVVDLPPAAFHLDHRFFTGLAAALLVATYDFWGYYNVAFLGGEVRTPGRTIPRAILLSIALVAGLYLLLTVSLLALVPWRTMLAAESPAARQAFVSFAMESAYGARFGPAAGVLAGRAAAVLVMVTAFASVFSLLLGYSRIPYAAARDGNFFPAFGRLHPQGGFPYVSLLYLAGAGALACFLSLGEVIASLVVLRIAVQFLLQHAGLLWLHRTQPGLPRPFRVPLYPLPPLVALCGFLFILLGRAQIARGLLGAAVVVLCGAAAWLVRARVRPAG